MESDSVPLNENGAGLEPVRSAFNTAVQLLEAGRASLLLRHTTEPVLVVVASIGVESNAASSLSIPIGQGIAGLVVERGVSLFGLVDGETFLSIPVATERGVEGVLNVTKRKGGKQYTPADIALATSAATHIGHLIQYGRYATRDPVSGLPNRRAFEETLERELALRQRTGSSFTVVFVDLDNLKTINDRYGHQKGDEVIRGVGNALHHILRPYDFAGRFGGDEFALLLSGTGEPESGITTRIADAVARVAEDLKVDVSASVGVARCPVDGTTGQQLVACADARMYENKRAKR